MNTKEILKKIYEYSLEDIMGERFGRYSKYIIQDRAIPDVRDGLKPVQRRILYGMWKERNTFDKPYRKSAKIIGNVMGNYHPHGDSSIYDAMVRLSQWWKLNTPYIDMHGNNGSMDGDSPAAMRYTESRLSAISEELLKDLDRNTVLMAPNFDDTEVEPTVLPAKFPNLLVNGSSGISSGYATNIPPHNLEEVIDGTIKRIDNPSITLESMMEIIKGPDFPTGGIIEGLDGIKSAYETGKGKIIIRAKTLFEEEKQLNRIVVTEIPYEVNKALLVKKIDDIKMEKKLDGLLEVRDESDKEGLRIAIDLKKSANKEVILKYLLKNTDLQVNFSINNVAIVNRTPKELGLLQLLDAYINHLKEVILRRTEFDLNFAKNRFHIVEGLIKVLSILDEVIQVIRSSKNKSDAKDNLVKEFDFSMEQAEAIVMLQLYKLTNTDVIMLEEELKKLEITINLLNEILSNEETLKKVMKDELRKVKKNYGTPRKSAIEAETKDLKIDITDVIPDEEVVIQVTKDGYIKRSSLRSFTANKEDIYVKDGDYPISLFNASTKDTVILFTNCGNYLFVPVINFPNVGWKELGTHVSNIVPLSVGEKIISSILAKEFNVNRKIVLVTKMGMIKQVLLGDFLVQRYSKPIKCIGLKKGDELLEAFETFGEEIIITTYNNYGLRFELSEVPVVGLKAKGVIGIKLKNDYVVSANLLTKEFIGLVYTSGNGKRIKLDDIPKYKRASRGILLLREIKTNPQYLNKSFSLSSYDQLGLLINDEITWIKSSDLPIKDRYQGGSLLGKKIKEVFFKISFNHEVEVENKEVEKITPDEVIKQTEDRLLTIDDFLKDFEIK